jgi:hypothetical protein
MKLGSALCGALPLGVLQALKACCLGTGATDLNSSTYKPMYEYIYITSFFEVLALLLFSWLFEKQYIQKNIYETTIPNTKLTQKKKKPK